MKKITEKLIYVSIILSSVFVFSTALMMLLAVNDSVFNKGTVQAFLMMYLTLMMLVISSWLLSALLTITVAEKERLNGE